MKSISDMAQDVELNTEIDELERKLEERLSKLNQMKQGEESNLIELLQGKERLLNDIKEELKQFNYKMDKMKKNLTFKASSTIEKKAQKINMDIAIIDKAKTSLEQRQKSLREVKHANDAEKFVQLKLGSSCLKEEELACQQISAGDKVRPLTFVLNKDIKRLRNDTDAELGRLSEVCVPEKVIHDRDIIVRLQSDENVCHCLGACKTTSGEIILTDFYNKRLKKVDLSSRHKIVDHLDMPDFPLGVCAIDSEQLAVTLFRQKIVQFVYEQPLKLGNSFSVGDACRDIDCYKELLYVCCGGSEIEQNREGPGHLAV